MDINEYFDSLNKEVSFLYDIAKLARSRGVDPETEPEIHLAGDLAARVEGLTKIPVSKRLRELKEKVENREELAFILAKEMVENKIVNYSSIEEACENALRVSLAILTEGVVAAPLEGIAKVKVKDNPDGTKYLAIYFAGPIRSAGGTAQALAVLIADYIRRVVGLDRYKPSEQEIERFVEEIELYQSEVTNLQYSPSQEEVRFSLSNIPVEITGDPTDRYEVSGYRNLKRIETNQIRGGAILALTEGVLQKANKLRMYVERLNLDGWDWIEKIKKESDEKEDKNKKLVYMDDIIGGRPVIAHPSAKGGFRLRYGRSRNSGLAAVGIHPACMVLLDNFIVTGTQIKIERPGKAGSVVPCSSIEGPLVRLKNGSVIKVNDVELAEKIKEDLDAILDLGEILIAFGEFLRNNHRLLPGAYCHEWWVKEVEKVLGPNFKYEELSERELVELSEKYGIPLHPKYTYFWHEIKESDYIFLSEYVHSNGLFRDGELILAMNSLVKKILEDLGVEHYVEKDIIVKEGSYALLKSLGLYFDREIRKKYDKISPLGKPDSLELAVKISGLLIRKKAPTRIGCRMGRPEKADVRKMRPAPHVLFPVGQAGGRIRSLNNAMKEEKIEVEIVNRICENCNRVTFLNKCVCGGRTQISFACPKCGRKNSNYCGSCNISVKGFGKQKIPIRELLEGASKNISIKLPETIKGVIGLTSKNKVPEPLEKGIIRAFYDLPVFKDGTIRVDMTDLPLTHFKPSEIGTSIETLKKLGYTEDYQGNPLENEEQIIELKIQDLVLSKSCADYLVRTAKYIDTLLEKFYKIDPYYRVEDPSDLIGHLVVGIAPHTSCGVVGRVIGYTDASACLAHPYFHAAKRRNCDGDEDAVILLLDALINFSCSYLPEKRGGKMDAPLVLTTHIDPREIDDEVHNLDCMISYPIEMYESSLKNEHPSKVDPLIDNVKKRINNEKEYEGIGFTHNTDINLGPKKSAYKTLATMLEKVDAQLSIANKVKAVDARDVAERVVNTHFLPDLYGNLRAFSRQKFRCVSCNTKHRRVPLSGKCSKCNGKLVLTVSHGSVEKYLEITRKLIRNYELGSYLNQRLSLLEDTMNSLFVNEKAMQSSLIDFV
ncbi:MAG: DNA polymerase II large subunit [Candidatus Hydrothermarchaeota archaeon]